MTLDKTRATTRTLTGEALKFTQTLIDWQLAQNQRAEKQIVSAFEASRTAMKGLADMQRDAANAWLNLVAPESADA